METASQASLPASQPSLPSEFPPLPTLPAEESSPLLSPTAFADTPKPPPSAPQLAPSAGPREQEPPAPQEESKFPLQEFAGLTGADLLLARAFKGFHLGENFGPLHDFSPPVGKENLPLANVNPQQTHFEFGDIIFDSRFDSGNMSRVEQTGSNTFDVFMNPDAKPYIETGGYRTWFYFCVAGVTPGETLSITMRGMNNQMKLYASGLKPCFRVLPNYQRVWRRIPGKVFGECNDNPFRMTFSHTFNCAKTDATFFAFSYPLSLSEIAHRADVFQQKYAGSSKIYFHREVLAHSLEGRKQELWTISSHAQKTEEREELIPGLFPEHEGDPDKRPFKFKKPTIFLTSRVHPGETPGSYVLNGMLDFLLNEKEEQARILRKRFVFKVIPILNVDGVARGYYRLDTRLVNLNRMYLDATQQEHPTIHAAKAAIVQQHKYGLLKFYIDLHAHAGKKGAFIFGNALQNEKQIENLLFPRLIALNSLNFDFLESNFSDKMMTVKDRKDGLSRQGSGRVGIYKETGLPHCYTLECNYQTGKRINYIPPKVVVSTGAIEPEVPVTDANNAKLYPDKKSPTFTIEIFEDVGRAVCLAVLDYIEQNPVSRVPRSNFKCIATLRAEIGINNNINVLENRKIKQKAQQQQREEAIRNQNQQRSGSMKSTKPPVRSNSSSGGGKNAIVNLRKQNTAVQIPHVHSEGADLSGLGADRLQLESVKEQEKEGLFMNEPFSQDSSDGGIEKKPVSAQVSTKKIKKLSGSKSSGKKKASGGRRGGGGPPPPPPLLEKKDSQELRTPLAISQKFKKDSEGLPCKIVHLDFNAAFDAASMGSTPKVTHAPNSIFGIGTASTRYGSLPPAPGSQISVVNSVQFDQPAGLYFSNQSIGENSSLPPPVSRRMLQNSQSALQSAKRKMLSAAATKPPTQRRNNPFKQAGASVVLKNPVVKIPPPFQEKMVLLSMPAQ